MIVFAAPVPCRRTGFHMISSSLYEPGGTMIRSPGAALSIADWIVCPGATKVGLVPPTVTVTASIDCLPFAAVMTNSPHSALVVPDGVYCACCCRAHVGMLFGTVTLIGESPQLTTGASLPP